MKLLIVLSITFILWIGISALKEWKDMIATNYIHFNDQTLMVRDVPSWSPGTSWSSQSKIFIPFLILDYIISKKKELRKDKEFKEKFVYGKSIQEANKAYGIH